MGPVVIRSEAAPAAGVVSGGVRFDGKRLNSPNDVVVKSDGSVWVTDPAYGIESDYEGHKSPSEIGSCNVYRVDGQNGKVTKVAGDFVQPNGIAFSIEPGIYISGEIGMRTEVNMYLANGKAVVTPEASQHDLIVTE